MKKLYRMLKRWKKRTKFVKKVLIGPSPRKIAMKTQSKPTAALLYFFILNFILLYYDTDDNMHTLRISKCLHRVLVIFQGSIMYCRMVEMNEMKSISNFFIMLFTFVDDIMMILMYRYC